jgi:CPA1 family monovalent cation:H+ antiporter
LKSGLTGDEYPVGSVNVQAVELVFLLLLLFVIAFGALAGRLKIPYPIVMVIGGGLLALIPGIPQIKLNPDVVFFIFLPPLLNIAAWTISWREFANNLVNTFFLAFGLVFFTVLGVAWAAPHLFPGFDWKAGLVLGAVVAPTDTIAATSIAQRIGLPKRISDILEGESLVNDATGLLALEFGIAILVHNQTPTVTEGVLRLIYLTVGGLSVGLLIGWITYHIERRIDHAPLEIALSVLVPYAAYLAADAIRSSGVLAVVSSGIYLSRRSSEFFSPSVRLQMWAFWEAFTFILNGLVFVLIGFQLRPVVAALGNLRASALITYGVLFSLLLIALRLVWVFPAARVAYLIRTRFLHHKLPKPPSRGVLVTGWTGMRGVIALAAAISLPQTLVNGAPFTQRNLVIFLAFSVILVTLVFQGLTLPLFIRGLGLANVASKNLEEEEARQQIIEIALAYLEEARSKDDKFEEMYTDLIGHYQQRLNVAISECDDADVSQRHHRLTDISSQLLRLERQTAVRLRNEGRINDETLREIERDLDLREAGGHPHAV